MFGFLGRNSAVPAGASANAAEDSGLHHSFSSVHVEVAGHWIACRNFRDTEILATGASPEEVIAKARQKGVMRPRVSYLCTEDIPA